MIEPVLGSQAVHGIRAQGQNVLPSFVALCVVLLAMFGAFLFGQAQANRGLGLVWQDSVKKGRLVADMQKHLLASAEAEKSAVMAETDEASAALAAESRRASAALENDRSELARLVVDGASDEVRHFHAFDTCWTSYRRVDDEILRLAVENTNLKAQNLSLMAAAAALDRMQAALDTLVTGVGLSVESPAIARRAYEVVPAALRIQLLEGRHIVEPRETEMDGIEAEMKLLDRRVAAGLSALSAASDAAGKALVETARAAYTDFQRVHTQVLALSRRNSNVRSLRTSLGTKRELTAQCQDHLDALQDAVRISSEATR